MYIEKFKTHYYDKGKNNMSLAQTYVTNDYIIISFLNFSLLHAVMKKSHFIDFLVMCLMTQRRHLKYIKYFNLRVILDCDCQLLLTNK